MSDEPAASPERSLERIADAQEKSIRFLEALHSHLISLVLRVERLVLALDKLAQYQTGPRFQKRKIGRYSYDGWQLWCFKHGPFFSDDPRLDKAACPHCEKVEL